MAVGKGSMERAAKAAGTDTPKKSTNTRKKKTPENGTGSEAKAAPEKQVPEAPVIKKEVQEQIAYQKSSGILERAAEPNERFGLGDAMPVYYF